MTISANGIKIIEGFEGCILHPYKDKCGIPTIGWGTTHYEDGTEVKMTDKVISQERADTLLLFEARTKAYVLSQTLTKDNVALNQNEFDSLCSFSYNTGVAGLLGSTLYRLIKQGGRMPWNIRPHFVEWNKGHVNGKLVVIGDLTIRRNKEADLFFTPVKKQLSPVN